MTANQPEIPNLRDPEWWAQDDARLQTAFDQFEQYNGLPLDQITPAVAARIASLALAEIVNLRQIVRDDFLAEPPKPVRRPRQPRVRANGRDQG
jgi:hypothetical protein